MMTTKDGIALMESDIATQNPLVSWRAIGAGLLIAAFSMLGLLGLGMAFGGLGLDEDTTARSAGMFTGIWFIASVFISILAGSYYSARMSKFQTARVGSAQGLIIASLVVGFIVYQSVSFVGSAGSALGTVVAKSAGAAAAGVQKASNNQTVMSYVNMYAEDALSELNFRAEPSVVAQGVVARLMNGNAEGAKNYLARQAGITPEEANARIATVRAEADKKIEEAKVAAGNGIESAGWTLFSLVLMGAIASVIGGSLGSKANLRRPLSREQFETSRQYAHA